MYVHGWCYWFSDLAMSGAVSGSLRMDRSWYSWMLKMSRKKSRMHAGTPTSETRYNWKPSQARIATCVCWNSLQDMCDKGRS